MKRRTGVSVATLHGVDAGSIVPSLAATTAYVYACDGNRELWEAQHRELLRGSRSNVSFVPWNDYFDAEKPLPPPTVAVLRTEMRRLRASSGLSLQELADKTKKAHIAEIVGERGLGPTTISDLCNPKHIRVPRRRTLHGFLLAIDAEETVIEQWLTVRNQLMANRDPHLESSTTAVNTPAQRTTAATAGTAELQHGRLPTEGDILLARFRRLRTDLIHGETTPSPERIQRVLWSIGIPAPIAGKLSLNREATTSFVLGTELEFERIMKESRLPSSSAGFALELAARRETSSQHLVINGLAEAIDQARDAQEELEVAESALKYASSQLEVAYKEQNHAQANIDEAWMRAAKIKGIAEHREMWARVIGTPGSLRTAEAWSLAVESHAVWHRIAEERLRKARTAAETSARRFQQATAHRDQLRQHLLLAVAEVDNLRSGRVVQRAPRSQ
ncbi:hypothetical protein [Glycomyces niveus]|uniref:HTH cro/C1-type domain-containing protein n=1 Tax=Glycomyces niveus TaxID=2820287 RepID=A0ABS3UAA3_9ACTN|nr:hypothetical protein [Glycomyces sp. NEAU-S30]MBO3735711.1 hypothetical protein [Glycomyces sp. NEAU-S30]